VIIVNRIADKPDLEAALAIREKVFVEEQNVPREAEYDQYEDAAHHYLARMNGAACGAARWRKTPNGIKLERFAVLPGFRNKEVGGYILRQVLQDVQAAYPHESVYLHAQLPAVPFYARHGFEQEGELFRECDIAHYKMVLRA
jgi:predicted GNAT family N-acyltransferase